MIKNLKKCRNRIGKGKIWWRNNITKKERKRKRKIFKKKQKQKEDVEKIKHFQNQKLFNNSERKPYQHERES